jgi:hypothetical protein
LNPPSAEPGKIAGMHGFGYPYNRAQPDGGSECDYLWEPGDVPADYQAVQGPPSGPTLGAVVDVGYGLSTRAWDRGRAAAESDGTGSPSDFPPGHVQTVHLGSGTQAFVENDYAGTGATNNGLAIYVLTRHHDFIAIYAWDADIAQLEKVARTVLAARAGAF